MYINKQITTDNIRVHGETQTNSIILTIYTNLSVFTNYSNTEHNPHRCKQRKTFPRNRTDSFAHIRSKNLLGQPALARDHNIYIGIHSNTRHTTAKIRSMSCWKWANWWLLICYCVQLKRPSMYTRQVNVSRQRSKLGFKMAFKWTRIIL